MKSIHFATAAAVASFLSLAACGGQVEESAPVREAALNVRVQPVQRSEMASTVSVVGTTEPFARATVAAQLMGRIVAAEFEEGQRVSAGQVLVRLEDAALQAAHARAKAGLGEARSARQLAEKTAQRLGNLFEEEAVSQQMLDDAETAFARSKAGERAARQALVQASVQLDYSAIAAPFDGYIVRKFAQVGDMAAPGAPLFVLEQLDSLKVEVLLPEHRRVDPGQQVQVEIAALDKMVDGRVLAQIQAADPRSRTFRAKIVIGNRDRRIGSGMFALALLPEAPRTALLVPSSALVRRGQLEGVYVVAEGRAQLRWLRLGARRGDEVEVLSGLDEGDRVVVAPSAELRAGRLVEVRSNG